MLNTFYGSVLSYIRILILFHGVSTLFWGEAALVATLAKH